MTPYLITSFEEATLAALIHEPYGYDHADIFDKPQITYIYNYLKSFMPEIPKDKKTVGSILLEHEYIDRDFLEDYSRFYLGRFGNDGYKCARLHFFNCDLTHKRLDALLAGDAGVELADDDDENAVKTVEQLQSHYLGFMVIKPLTRTFVGKTCLRVSGDRGDGKKKIDKPYDVNLFGIKLTINSIAFQEQDKVVAACATTAIWTALHSLPGRGVKDIKSCSEITTAALNFVDGSSNGFPNKELTNKQIQRTLDVEGLRYHNTNLEQSTQESFRDYLIAHIDSDLPVILTGTVYGVEPNESGEHVKAGHAITALGYDFRDCSKWVYVHDDRLGPYARAEIVMVEDCLGAATPDTAKGRWGLAMSIREADATTWVKPHEIIVPDISIIPADRKTRIDFKFAHGTAERIRDQVIGYLEDEICPMLGIDVPAVDYEVKLASIARARDDVRQHRTNRNIGDVLGTYTLDEERMIRWRKEKLGFLTGNLARLQWQIDVHWNSEPAFRVFLDATDIPLGNAVSGIYILDPIHADAMLAGFIGHESQVAGLDDQHFFPAFTRAVKQRRDDYESHLNSMYGTLRAPNHIKQNEVARNGKGTNPTAKKFWDPQQIRLIEVHEAYKKVAEAVASDPGSKSQLIWAIGKDGELFIAEDIPKPDELGHPSMTGMQAARIAGEIKPKDGHWEVNFFSGRYSGDYADVERTQFLTNAVYKIRSLFPYDKFEAFYPDAPASTVSAPIDPTVPAGGSDAEEKASADT
ncbi:MULTISPECIES: hypothetical protein [Pseudomonas syringae group]|uniref:hypothetical protein n=1 Tax=Pseudomonas syringae group TaxID=136849 RepID=UPI0006CB3CF5|nr:MULTISPECIES: hypothetical protein [Pseudomonas syringae group]ALE00382.1 hypothetical protein PSYRMG_09770 [Pseudomonas syringae UMAF0158]MCI3911799.1 hypothetical protein [Pseudomonas viridiflava]MCK9730329.1 hypothetical protein [Pseudomonas syringae pv. syringae]